jgi:hypothetical protein
VNQDQNQISLALAAVRLRISDQSERLPAPLFTFDRNGLRLAIAAMEDEIQELWEEWNNNKRHLGNAHKEIEHELLDIAAVALITYIHAMKAE